MAYLCGFLSKSLNLTAACLCKFYCVFEGVPIANLLFLKIDSIDLSIDLAICTMLHKNLFPLSEYSHKMDMLLPNAQTVPHFLPQASSIYHMLINLFHNYRYKNYTVSFNNYY